MLEGEEVFNQDVAKHGDFTEDFVEAVILAPAKFSMDLAFFGRFFLMAGGMAKPLKQRIEDDREMIQEFLAGKVVGRRDLSILPHAFHPIGGNRITLVMEEIRQGVEGGHIKGYGCRDGNRAIFCTVI